MKYFEKKYSFDIKIISEDKFIIPEYSIDLLNKSKKIIFKVENVNSIIQLTKNKSKSINSKKIENKDKNKGTVKNKDRIKKTKSKKKIRTLWVRRKKKIK